MTRPEKVLVTGGAGYLGSMLVPLLLKSGYHVRVLDLNPWSLHVLWPVIDARHLELIRGDIRDERTVKVALSDVDAVVNLAGVVGFPACNDRPFAARTTNAEAVRLLTSLLDGQKLVQASTTSIYGKVAGVCDEDTAMNPTSLYAQTKAVADNETLKYGGVALRFATAFGLSPRMRLDLLVNYIVYEAVRHARFPIFQSSARRSFIHCVDVARAIQFSLENYDRMKSQAYNVGSRNLNYTKKELADKVREQYSFQLVEVGQGSDEDSRDYIVSFEKLNKLGFNTTITIENGIGELLKIMPSFREEGRFQNP